MRTSNELSTLYKSIDQKNISESAKETLKKIRLANKNFKGKDEDAQELFIDFFNKLKSSKPVAVKTTQEYKDALKKAQIERGRKMREAKGTPKAPKGGGTEEDANRPAKPFGWRMRGKHNYRKPTRDDISKGRAYYEGRVNRADVKRKKYPMLERGGKLEEKVFSIYPHSVGKAKYVIDVYDGNATNKDGSPFIGIRTAQNKVKLNSTISSLKEDGFKEVDNVFNYLKTYEDGGYMAEGGEVGKSFKISEMNEKIDRMFPDSFGFSVGTFSNEGNKNRNSSALIANENDPFRGLKDTDIDAKLFFPQYKKVHDIRFRIYQGGENTYFYFNLESEKGDEYIGQFGFKDQGNVPSSYITRFIAFLMEQYGLPFEVNHSVMAKGGEIFGDSLNNVRSDAKSLSRNYKQDMFIIEQKEYNFSPKRVVTQFTIGTKEDVDYIREKTIKNENIISIKILGKYSNGELKSSEEEILYMKSKYAKGGTIGGMSTYVSARDIEEIKLTINGDMKTLKGSDLMDGVYVKKASLKAKFDAYEVQGKLANISYDVWDKLKIDSGSQIYASAKLQENLSNEYEKAGIDSVFKKYSKTQRKAIAEALTDENQHSLRQYLALRGYLGDEEYNDYKRLYGEYPKNFLNPTKIKKLVTMAEGGEVFYTEKHKND